MSREPSLSAADSQNEDLVAYLDGELDEPSRQEIERRLADDASFRSRLSHLQRTWDMLDVLGRAGINESFTRTTVEMIALQAAKDVQHKQAAISRRRIAAWIGGASAAVAAAAAGYILLSQHLGRPNRELVRDLPVIERVDEYRSADSVEFLQALDQSGLFASEPDNES